MQKANRNTQKVLQHHWNPFRLFVLLLKLWFELNHIFLGVQKHEGSKGHFWRMSDLTGSGWTYLKWSEAKWNLVHSCARRTRNRLAFFFLRFLSSVHISVQLSKMIDNCEPVQDPWCGELAPCLSLKQTAFFIDHHFSFPWKETA